MTIRSCQTFRSDLERALRGRPMQALERSQALGFNEHLVVCAECRALFEEEESLETMLAAWMSSELTSDQRDRLLARLRATRDGDSATDNLDQLLELDRSSPAPDDLAQRVLVGLVPERSDRKLDELLDVLPAPAPPANLATRVLADLEPVRRPRPRLSLLPGGVRTLAALAAALIVVFGLWRFGLARDPEDAQQKTGLLAALPQEGDEELLASMEILENWDLLMAEDMDALLADLDDADLALLALADGPLLEEILLLDSKSEEEE